jgi:hypothetical protein
MMKRCGLVSRPEPVENKLPEATDLLKIPDSVLLEALTHEQMSELAVRIYKLVLERATEPAYESPEVKL